MTDDVRDGERSRPPLCRDVSDAEQYPSTLDRLDAVGARHPANAADGSARPRLGNPGTSTVACVRRGRHSQTGCSRQCVSLVLTLSAIVSRENGANPRVEAN